MASGVVVFDTSTLVACCLNPHGIPGQALLTALDRCILVASQDTLSEVVAVLQRPKFDVWRRRDQRLAFLAGYASSVRRVEPPPLALSHCRDPKDDKFLALAADAGAQWMVSSDDDLLVLGEFRGARIVTAAVFLASMQAAGV